jgi:hypothetical protein
MAVKVWIVMKTTYKTKWCHNHITNKMKMSCDKTALDIYFYRIFHVKCYKHVKHCNVAQW